MSTTVADMQTILIGYSGVYHTVEQIAVMQGWVHNTLCFAQIC